VHPSGVTLIAYMPLASGALTGKYSATARPAGWRRYTGHFRAKNLAALTGLIESLREIGARHRGPARATLVPPRDPPEAQDIDRQVEGYGAATS
jgi:aryl-alcohol dehydrogenase-like predicted oxidoreductase